VDPNQAWTPADLKRFAPALVEHGVVLIEQPVAVGAETELPAGGRRYPSAPTS
jgi:L-alanine-DL-glutamate epimerase-like enolase superfamily enzyme